MPREAEVGDSQPGTAAEIDNEPELRLPDRKPRRLGESAEIKTWCDVLSNDGLCVCGSPDDEALIAHLQCRARSGQDVGG